MLSLIRSLVTRTHLVHCTPPAAPNPKGGCLNPLHIHWDLQQQNLMDQQTKKTRQNRGSKAKNLTPVYRLVPN